MIEVKAPGSSERKRFRETVGRGKRRTEGTGALRWTHPRCSRRYGLHPLITSPKDQNVPRYVLFKRKRAIHTRGQRILGSQRYQKKKIMLGGSRGQDPCPDVPQDIGEPTAKGGKESRQCDSLHACKRQMRGGNTIAGQLRMEKNKPGRGPPGTRMGKKTAEGETVGKRKGVGRSHRRQHALARPRDSGSCSGKNMNRRKHIELRGKDNPGHRTTLGSCLLALRGRNRKKTPQNGRPKSTSSEKRTAEETDKSKRKVNSPKTPAGCLEWK